MEDATEGGNVKSSADLGMVGLGTMGRNLLLNLADHGYTVTGYDLDPDKVDLLETEARGRGRVLTASTLPDLVVSLRPPRAVMLLIPSGPPVEAVVRALATLLHPGDVVIDGGNSHFRETGQNQRTLSQHGIHLLGMGISGGEAGARSGPSLMPGGPREAWDRVRPLFEAVAARAGDGRPCVAWLGPGPAGHFVKMVHNGIEYILMQLLAETYDLMRRGWGMTGDEIRTTYEAWNGTELNSYLLQIAGNIFRLKDDRTGDPLIEFILDAARQKGTGTWTAQEAMELQVPVPALDAAVALRNLSARKEERQTAEARLGNPVRPFDGDRDAFLERMRRAYYAAMILAYAQGLSLLEQASRTYSYDLNLETVARIWRAGCIIRAALLEEIRRAYAQQPGLPSLVLDDHLGGAVLERLEDLREVACAGLQHGIPVPAFTASLGYYDGYRSGWLPANLIQAMRDYFGAHTYERTDITGSFHTLWEPVEIPDASSS
ncbi:MAG: NADP-dependent phosphogluconate dehydrogenase [Candidatus Zixiibacteriota bacterium]|nr:MAG: NADP-dependent phosphogluconate dehydrogenase [candidate division Zixibacteria bacterium]